MTTTRIAAIIAEAERTGWDVDVEVFGGRRQITLTGTRRWFSLDVTTTSALCVTYNSRDDTYVACTLNDIERVVNRSRRQRESNAFARYQSGINRLNARY